MNLGAINMMKFLPPLTSISKTTTVPLNVSFAPRVKLLVSKYVQFTKQLSKKPL
jgi:hypothetical protein